MACLRRRKMADENYRKHNVVNCSCMAMPTMVNPFDITPDAASGMGCMAPEPPPNPPSPLRRPGQFPGRLRLRPQRADRPRRRRGGLRGGRPDAAVRGRVRERAHGHRRRPGSHGHRRRSPSDLDWTTFQLGDITFGSNVIAVPAGLQSYSTTRRHHEHRRHGASGRCHGRARPEHRRRDLDLPLGRPDHGPVARGCGRRFPAPRGRHRPGQRLGRVHHPAAGEPGRRRVVHELGLGRLRHQCADRDRYRHQHHRQHRARPAACCRCRRALRPSSP